MFRSKRTESKGLMDNVAGILASSVIVIFLFMLTVSVMNGFVGEQDSGPEVEIDLLYDDIKESCSSPDSPSSGTVDISSDSSRSYSSLTVCEDNEKRLCYDGTAYGDGDLAGACSEGIVLDGCDDGISGEQQYSIKVSTSDQKATIECEDT